MALEGFYGIERCSCFSYNQCC